MKVSIIGAGAAGCFCAIELKRQHPEADVHVYERGPKVLAKVAVTGGGRCNLTNSFADFTDENGRYRNLQLVYPRGDKLMRKMLSAFSHKDTCEWFEREGVRLVTQDDECVFPQSQDAMEIVNTLSRLMQTNGVKVHLGCTLKDVTKCAEGGYDLCFDGWEKPVSTDILVIATGGGKAAFLKTLGVKVVDTLPSLFTFNIEGGAHEKLMGTVVENTEVRLAGTKYKANGPLLWTHWGVSGPAVLKLSSYAARTLAGQGYKGMMLVNWCGGRKEDHVRSEIEGMMRVNVQKMVTNVYPAYLTQKHWLQMLEQCSVPSTQRWGALNATHVNRLVGMLTSQPLDIVGRCHYKAEFVTCGGVALTEVSAKTLQHKALEKLYFAGEALDVDAITGGFNLQAAWSMAKVVADNCLMA